MPTTSQSPTAMLSDYHSYPITFSSPAWQKVVYLQNPARVHEMSQRLATVVQAAWHELSKKEPALTTLSFCVWQKQVAGKQRDLVNLTLTLDRPSLGAPFMHIALQDEVNQPQH